MPDLRKAPVLLRNSLSTARPFLVPSISGRAMSLEASLNVTLLITEMNIVNIVNPQSHTLARVTKLEPNFLGDFTSLSVG